MRWALLTLVLALAPAGRAAADSRLGNGGDCLAAEFVARGYKIVADLQTAHRVDLTDDEIRGMRAALIGARVYSTDEKLKDRKSGQEVDAIVVVAANGDQTVLLNRQRAMFAYEHAELFDRMVFHELLHLIGISDYLYFRSARQFPSATRYSPGKISQTLPEVEGEERRFTCGPRDNDGDIYGETINLRLFDNAVELSSSQFKADLGFQDETSAGAPRRVFRHFRYIGDGDASTAVILEAERSSLLLQISGATDGVDSYECTPSGAL